MAVSYPIPGWLNQQADLAGSFARGYQASAAIGEAQARLDMEAQQMAVQMAERQAQLKQQQLKEENQLAVTKSYHEAMTGLQQSRLAEAKQRTDLATQTAARRYVAQQGYLKRFQDLGGDENAARRAMLEFGPSLGVNATGMAGILKGAPANPVWVSPDPTTGAPGYLRTAGGGAHIPARLKDPNEVSQSVRAATLRAEEKELASNPFVAGRSQLPKDADPTFKKEIQEQKDRFKMIRDELDKITFPSTAKSAFRIMRNPKGQKVRVPIDVDPDKIKGYTEVNAD